MRLISLLNQHQHFTGFVYEKAQLHAASPQRSQKLTRVCSIKLTHHEVSDVGTDQTGSCAPIYA